MFQLSTTMVIISAKRLMLIKTIFFLFFRKFIREFKMPEGVLQDQISSSYSSDGILTISAPRVINAPGKLTPFKDKVSNSLINLTDSLILP